MLIVDDKLTLPLRRWFITKVGEDSQWAYLVTCHWCISIWIGVPWVFFSGYWPNRWMLMANCVLVASLVAGLLGKTREP